MIEDLLEHWYAVLPSNELGGEPTTIQRFGEKYVLWRRSDGTVAALPDACPHRRVSLGGGRVVDDCIECPFHGFRYDGQGQCRRMPAQGPGPVSSHYRAEAAPPVGEAHGYIWMWRGEAREDLPPIRFFPDARDGLIPTRGFTSRWPVHYSRAIENQLDFTHLPFVHATTIGRNLEPVMEVECESDDRSIRAWRVGHESNPLELLLPNVWMLRISERMAMQAAFFPIDETSCDIHVRARQGFVRLGGLRQLLGRVMDLENRRILRQDERVVVTSNPQRFSPEHREMLVPSDRAVLEYRRLVMRQRKQHEAGEDLHREVG